MKKNLVLIGGGHAHMVTLANLHAFIEKGFGVTVIQPSEYHYYSGMGPGMLGGTYKPDDIRFAEGLPKTRSGKIMRRLLKQIASGTEIKGDTTTLEDFSVLARLGSADD